MNVLVIGGGGREHALAWRLRNSPSVKKLYAAPGNPGICSAAECYSTQDYVQLAQALSVDLTVVGPEAPLVNGLVDKFRANRMPIVGPVAENASLEGSKTYAKQMMRRLGVPTARFNTAETPAEAQDSLSHFRFPVVLKTDGLAAGKGVVIAHNRHEAAGAIASLLFPLVVEEYLEGEEVSFIALCDGRHAVPLEPAQDHKRVFDDDEGPNTGGMGAYSDSRILTGPQTDRILDTIINPVVRETRFTGFLYAGIMMTPDGPSVLEFNVRLGDPETQPLMVRLQSDWGEVLMSAAQGTLSPGRLQWSPDPATCVVLSSGGYPGSFTTGYPITGIDDVTDAFVFHAGTSTDRGRLVTSGGRVVGVTATGPDLRQSIDRAYQAISKIHFEGMHYRTDIGRRGLERYNKEVVGT